MWKCKWGCDIFHHRAALSVGKPVNTGCSKVRSDQISSVITSIKELRTQSFGRLGGERNQARAVSHWVIRSINVACCVQGVWRLNSTQRKRKRISEVGDVQVSDVQRLNRVENPPTSPGHIWRFVPNPLKFKVCKFEISIHSCMLVMIYT